MLQISLIISHPFSGSLSPKPSKLAGKKRTRKTSPELNIILENYRFVWTQSLHDVIPSEAGPVLQFGGLPSTLYLCSEILSNTKHKGGLKTVERYAPTFFLSLFNMFITSILTLSKLLNYKGIYICNPRVVGILVYIYVLFLFWKFKQILY